MYELIYYSNSYMHVMQVPIIKRRNNLWWLYALLLAKHSLEITIIPSAKKWVFHAIYCLASLSLYG